MSGKRLGEEYVYPISEYAGKVPPLPPVRTIEPDTYVGPTEESNWVLMKRLLVGAYPSSVHDEANTKILTGILRLGVTTFVCLQQEYQHEGVKEFEWRTGVKLRPYIFDAIKLVDVLPASLFPTGARPDGLEFVHFPIVDCAIANDSSVLQLCHDLVGRLVRGENLYIHCWGGHGRTGTVVAIMLGLLYGLQPLDSMRWVQFCHDMRIAPMGVPSPQTEAQRQQVIRILHAVRQAQGVSRSPRNAIMSPQQAGAAGSNTAAAAAVSSTPPVGAKATAAAIASRAAAAASAPNAPPAVKAEAAAPQQASSSGATPATTKAAPGAAKPPAASGDASTANPTALAKAKAAAAAAAPAAQQSAQPSGIRQPQQQAVIAAAQAAATRAALSAVRQTSLAPSAESAAPQAPASGAPAPVFEGGMGPLDVGLVPVASAAKLTTPHASAAVSPAAAGHARSRRPSSAGDRMHTARQSSSSSSAAAAAAATAAATLAEPESIARLPLASITADVVLADGLLKGTSPSLTALPSPSAALANSAHSGGGGLHAHTYVGVTGVEGGATPLLSPAAAAQTGASSTAGGGFSVDSTAATVGVPGVDLITPRMMVHMSPRPFSQLSLVEAPSTAAVLADPVATAVDPLASTTATVLGLGPLVASRTHLAHHNPPPASALLSASGSATSVGGGNNSARTPTGYLAKAQAAQAHRRSSLPTAATPKTAVPPADAAAETAQLLSQLVKAVEGLRDRPLTPQRDPPGSPSSMAAGSPGKDRPLTPSRGRPAGSTLLEGTQGGSRMPIRSLAPPAAAVASAHAAAAAAAAASPAASATQHQLQRSAVSSAGASSSLAAASTEQPPAQATAAASVSPRTPPPPAEGSGGETAAASRHAPASQAASSHYVPATRTGGPLSTAVQPPVGASSWSTPGAQHQRSGSMPARSRIGAAAAAAAAAESGSVAAPTGRGGSGGSTLGAAAGGSSGVSRSSSTGRGGRGSISGAPAPAAVAAGVDASGRGSGGRMQRLRATPQQQQQQGSVGGRDSASGGSRQGGASSATSNVSGGGGAAVMTLGGVRLAAVPTPAQLIHVHAAAAAASAAGRGAASSGRAAPPSATVHHPTGAAAASANHPLYSRPHQPLVQVIPPRSAGASSGSPLQAAPGGSSSSSSVQAQQAPVTSLLLGPHPPATGPTPRQRSRQVVMATMHPQPASGVAVAGNYARAGSAAAAAAVLAGLKDASAGAAAVASVSAASNGGGGGTKDDSTRPATPVKQPAGNNGAIVTPVRPGSAAGGSGAYAAPAAVPGGIALTEKNIRDIMASLPQISQQGRLLAVSPQGPGSGGVLSPNTVARLKAGGALGPTSRSGPTARIAAASEYASAGGSDAAAVERVPKNSSGSTGLVSAPPPTTSASDSSHAAAGLSSSQVLQAAAQTVGE